MLRCQAVFGEQDSHPAGSPESGGQLAVAAQRPELVAAAVHEQQHAAGVRPGSHEPVGRHPAGAHRRHLHVVGDRVEAACGSEAGALLQAAWAGLGWYGPSADP